MRVVSCLAFEHDLRLVLLAAFVCVCGSWVALDLIKRAHERKSLQRSGWTFLAAVAAGSSIWCTHFIAMLAYSNPAPVTFDPLMTLLSLLLAIAGCGLGVAVALREEQHFAPAIGGGIIGLAIAGMHYAGMAAYHVDGWIHWHITYVVLSLVLVIVLSAAALHTFLGHPSSKAHHASLPLLVLGIVCLHFTGMTAFDVTPAVTGAGLEDQAAFTAIAVAVAAVGMIVVATGIASNLIDSHATRESIERIQAVALTDPLTSMPNRISFHNQLTQALVRAADTERKVAILGIDLDRFKEINDLRGHDAGDRTLKILSARLKNIAGDNEWVARIGGDEFAAAIIYREQMELSDFLARVQAALHQPFYLDDLETVPAASIGVAIFPSDGDTLERLIANADLAMYRAKNEPSRSVCFYEAAMDEASRDRLSLALDIRTSIERGELHLNYQVQKLISTNEICGYEVLLRWTHPTRGIVAPSDFIPLAEETGSIVPIGEWVLRTACAEAATWPEPHRIAVNISPVQLSHTDLAKLIQDIVTETNLDPTRLELEITETTIIQDKVRTLDQLRRIQALGITVAIDDFGTGYSSLDTLRSFPFNKIKLDRSFMNELNDSPQATAIVRAVLALGKSLNVPVLAEGVETPEQLATLKAEGCNEAQGYFLGRPGTQSDTVDADNASAAPVNASVAA